MGHVRGTKSGCKAEDLFSPEEIKHEHEGEMQQSPTLVSHTRE